MRGEQGFLALTLGVVAEAGAIQEGSPFSAGQLDGGLKQRFLAVWR